MRPTMKAEIKDKQGERVFVGTRFEAIGALNTLRKETEKKNKRVRNHKNRVKNFETVYRVEAVGAERY